MSFIPTLVFLALLAACVRHDLRARRIPNAVVFPGMLAALALHAFLPAGMGLFCASIGTPMGGLGLASGLGGLALGLAFLMPLYALRLMGAGDVKMLAMAGAFVGAGQVLALTLATLLAGGVLALVVAARQRKLRQLVANAGQMVAHTGLSALAGVAAPVPAPAAASGRLPYAVAIAVASVACVLWLRTHGALPL